MGNQRAYITFNKLENVKPKSIDNTEAGNEPWNVSLKIIQFQTVIFQTHLKFFFVAGRNLLSWLDILNSRRSKVPFQIVGPWRKSLRSHVLQLVSLTNTHCNNRRTRPKHGSARWDSEANWTSVHHSSKARFMTSVIGRYCKQNEYLSVCAIHCSLSKKPVEAFRSSTRNSRFWLCAILNGD